MQVLLLGIGLVVCLAVPVQADPFGILGSATSLMNTVEQQKRMQIQQQEQEQQKQEWAERQERDQRFEDERFEMEKQRFEMERQRFEMEMMERKKALQSEYETGVEMKEGKYVREEKFPREEPKVRYQGRKSSREERAAARAAERLRQEQKTLEEE